MENANRERRVLVYFMGRKKPFANPSWGHRLCEDQSFSPTKKAFTMEISP